MRKRITLRINKPLHERLKARAEKNGRSVNEQIEMILNDRTGYNENNPIIIASGTEYLYISPLGRYYPCTPQMYHRFIKSGYISIIGGEDWSEEFSSMKEVIQCLGTPVCKWSDTGVIVMDIDKFIQLHEQCRGKR